MATLNTWTVKVVPSTGGGIIVILRTALVVRIESYLEPLTECVVLVSSLLVAIVYSLLVAIVSSLFVYRVSSLLTGVAGRFLSGLAPARRLPAHSVQNLLLAVTMIVSLQEGHSMEWNSLPILVASTIVLSCLKSALILLFWYIECDLLFKTICLPPF